MGNLDKRESMPIKTLFIGDSKTGKTGALAALAKAGYNLRILDFDNGTDILVDLLRSDKAAFDRVTVETLTDTFKIAGGRAVPTSATAWTRMTQLLNHWITNEYDLGPITSWTTKDVLVLDSATFAGKAVMRHHLQMEGRLATLPQWTDWNGPQQMMEQLFSLLYSEAIKCHVVVLSHIIVSGDQITVEDPKIPGKFNKITRPGSERGLPSMLGKAISPTVGRYFNSLLMVKSVPWGTGVKRVIYTDSQVTDSYGMIELGNSAPLSVKKEYPLETGLAEFFKAARPQQGA